MASGIGDFAEWYSRISADPLVFAVEAFLCDGIHNPALTFQQVALLEAARAETFLPVDQRKKRIAVKSGQGTGKCLVGDVRIFDHITGETRTIREWAARGDRIRVACMDEETEKLRVADAAAFASGQKPCVRLSVDAGQSIELSDDHPVYTPRGWVEAGALRLGDLVAGVRRLPEDGEVVDGIFWVKVAAVEEIGTLPVYDLTVPGVGNFVANNLVVHNTTCECILAAWRAFFDVDALVVVTAPTAVQIKDAWLAEFRRLLQKSHPFLQSMVEVTNTKVKIGGRPTWGIWSRSASRPENFQGYHQKYLTFIVDEASGVDREIFKVIKGTLTNENSLLVCAGNPNTRECAFFDMFHKPSERDLWHRFTFNAEESPITDKENIRRIAQEFGTNSDTYRIRVLGEFPLADPNCVVSSDDLWACTGTDLLECSMMRGLKQRKVIAIDFARYGSDESVIYRRSGHAIVEKCIFARTEPVIVAEKAFNMQRKAGWTNQDCIFVVDAGGMGQGVLGQFYKNHKRVHEFHSQHKSGKPDYADKITEAYFNVAKLARERRIHIPDDEILIQQLSSRLYKTDNKGKLKLEKKDDYVKRMEGQSPDRADALVMAFYDQHYAEASII